MALGQIGPLTALLEWLATMVGSGILLGGFVMGILGLLMGQSMQVLAARAMKDGYAGGAVGVLLVLADLILRYA
jgi:hypothetical protein